MFRNSLASGTAKKLSCYSSIRPLRKLACGRRRGTAHYRAPSPKLGRTICGALCYLRSVPKTAVFAALRRIAAEAHVSVSRIVPPRVSAVTEEAFHH